MKAHARVRGTRPAELRMLGVAAVWVVTDATMMMLSTFRAKAAPARTLVGDPLVTHVRVFARPVGIELTCPMLALRIERWARTC